MGVNSLPKTVTRQRRDCDLNPGPSAPESRTLTTRLPSHLANKVKNIDCGQVWAYTSITPPRKSAHPRRRFGLNTYESRAKRHLDRFSRFSITDGRDQQTDGEMRQSTLEV